MSFISKSKLWDKYFWIATCKDSKDYLIGFFHFELNADVPVATHTTYKTSSLLVIKMYLNLTCALYYDYFLSNLFYLNLKIIL